MTGDRTYFVPNATDHDGLSLVSHEIRASLTVISGYVRLLERDLDDATRAKALSESLCAVERIDGLLDDLLAAACTSDCLAPRVLEPVDVSRLVEEVAASYQDISSHRFSVATECEAVVTGDRGRLRQALANLVGNAIEHTPDGEAVGISVSCEPDRVVVKVEDEGPGIPEDLREHVFERFARLGSHPDTRPGAGQGLYIVRAIVEAHGGTVRAENRDGYRGARFVIELPVAQRAEDG